MAITMNRSHALVLRLAESAILIAIGTVLSLFPLPISIWAYGGGITFCSTLPLVILSHRYGCKWGFFCGLVYSILQLILGISNVQYATSFIMAVGIIFLDYIIAFSVIGLSAMFNKVIKNRAVSLIVGMVVTFFLRFVCHFFSGWWIWDALWPNELGMTSVVYSIFYNGSYMLPELVISAVVAGILYAPLKKYFHGEELQKLIATKPAKKKAA